MIFSCMHVCVASYTQLAGHVWMQGSHVCSFYLYDQLAYYKLREAL